MIKHPDHVTIVVSDMKAAKQFFALLNFKEMYDVVIEKEPFSTYMHIPGVKAEHVTLVLQHENVPAVPHFEIQLLYFYTPQPKIDPNIHRLDKYGYNHLCFTVDDIEEQIEKLRQGGVKILSDELDYHGRKLVYFEGPDGMIFELAQWMVPSS